jgi:hypothetical protein
LQQTAASSVASRHESLSRPPLLNFVLGPAEEGAMKNLSLSWVVRARAVAAAAVLLLGQRAHCQGLTPRDFEKLKTLNEAVEVVKDRLRQDGKPEYAALLSEARVRDAIRTALKSYQPLLEQSEKQTSGSKEHFQKEVQPICLKVADKGEWPAGCSFFCFYTLTDQREGRNIAYDGLGLRLQIATPNAKFKSFALPIVDLYFGKFAGPSD